MKKSTRYSSKSLGRHRKFCSICKHACCGDIEADYVSWGSPSRIAGQYQVSTDSLHRHVSACGLREKRSRNIKKALERIIEQAERVEVTASSVVSAIQVYGKINAQGQLIERQEHINLNSLFEKMTVPELEDYAKIGNLPAWFRSTVGAVPTESEE